ncbi:ABC transporter substrate-binding protein [Psychromonas marina]|nr:ABC transporter substrate-binding protein [Psychromonas marina]
MKPILTSLLLLISSFTFANQSDWQTVTDKARGQTVYFFAWAGSNEINNYLRWANKSLQAQYGVTLKHVKVSDVSESISQLVTEKIANKNTDGRVDMLWVNGENFKSMKQHQLLGAAFVEQLPNWEFVDKTLPIDNDFAEPTLGLEAPWGVGQLVFIYDKQTIKQPPTSFVDLLAYAQQHPGKISYPKPPAFHGTSFLKAALLELSNNDPLLYQAVDSKNFEAISAPLWEYLDKLHPLAWQKGDQFPANGGATLQMLDDKQLDIAISFNPNEVISAQVNGTLATTTAAYAMQAGALSNIHFLAIPWNASAREGALVAINFLLSPEAQSRKGDLAIWGDPTVLEKQHITGSAKETTLFKSIPEPHPSWQAALEQEWQKRYGH